MDTKPQMTGHGQREPRARRAYTAPPDEQRCKADRSQLRGDGKGEGARCMRRATTSGFCAQHAKGCAL